MIERREQVTLPVVGTADRFPVRRVYCVGRNYIAHVREMGGNENRDPPIFFQKPTGAIVQNGAIIPYPTMTKDFHYELEMAVALKSGGYNIPESETLDHIYGYFELKAGDIILTGTPHGVGSVQPGDELVGTIDGLEPLTVRIGSAAA